MFRRLTTSKTTLLAILCGVQFIDAFDVASMAPALPRIAAALHMSPTSLQWVVTAYVLGYGGFLLLGGRLADLFDRKRLLLGALLAFVVASTVGGLVYSGGLLIGARLAKGITAAFTAPASLAILLRLYSDENEQHKALGAYLTVSSVGFTSGLLLGGLLADATWRLVMLVPAGLAFGLLVAGGTLIPRQATAVQQRDRVDVIGALTATAGLMALVYGVSRASTQGWGNALTVAGLAVGVALLVAFVLVERVHESPIVPLGIFRRPGVARGNAMVFFLQGCYVSWQFIATLYLQNVQHGSPVEAGLVFAPGGLVVLATAQLWARLVAKHGPSQIAIAGIALMIAGNLWSLELGRVDSVLVFALATTISGFGFTMTFTAANISSVAGAPQQEQGLASGLFLASFQVGAGVILGVVASVFDSELHTGAAAYRYGILTAIGAAAVTTVLALTGVRRRTATALSPARTAS